MMKSVISKRYRLRNGWQPNHSRDVACARLLDQIGRLRCGRISDFYFTWSP